MDSVSEEERASKEWATERANLQWGYESLMRRDGREPVDFESDSPLVRMILEALNEWEAMGDRTPWFEYSPQYQRAIDLFA